jgi:predicted transcriptional regulator
MMWIIGGSDMRTVTLGIASRRKINRRFLQALEGEAKGTFISFESPALLFKLLSGKRWELLKTLTGAGPLTLRETARRLGRDVKAVHGDVHKLLEAGILQKTEEGFILFPYDVVHVDFLLKAA